MGRDLYLTALDAKRLRDIGGGSKDGTAFDIYFHRRVGRGGLVGRGRWIEQCAAMVLAARGEILTLESVLGLVYRRQGVLQSGRRGHGGSVVCDDPVVPEVCGGEEKYGRLGARALTRLSS